MFGSFRALSVKWALLLPLTVFVLIAVEIYTQTTTDEPFYERSRNPAAVSDRRPAALDVSFIVPVHSPSPRWLLEPEKVVEKDDFCIQHPLEPHFCLPNFCVVGAQKAGTGTVKLWFQAHPGIGMKNGENHFFDSEVVRCTVDSTQCQVRVNGWHFLKTFGALSRHLGLPYGSKTPSYLYIPVVPKLMSKFTPWMKHIVLLRNPTERAYSGYGQAFHANRRYWRRERDITGDNVSLQLGTLGEDRIVNASYPLLFHQLVTQEVQMISNASRYVEHRPGSNNKDVQARLFRGVERFDSLSRWDLLFKLLQSTPYGSTSMTDFCVLKSLYDLQLRHWFQFFSKDSFLILISEEAFLDPVSAVREIEVFLRVKHANLTKSQLDKRGGVVRGLRELPMLSTTRELLNNFFFSHILALEKLLDRKLHVWYKH